MGDELPRRKRDTHRMDTGPRFEDLPKDRCGLTMLTGPHPGSFRIVGGEDLTLGRDPELPWCIEDRAISSHHARVTCAKGAFWLIDLGSTNGTYVNGRRIGKPWQLHDGDRIQLGEDTLLRVSLQDATEAEASHQLYQAAVLDSLTGVYNRGHLEAVLVAEYAFAARHKSPLAVVFIDLDHFTRVNNTHGHLAGDAVLRTTATAIRHAVRTEDLVARYGGEEFVLVARGIDLNGAAVMAERVRRTVESAVTEHDGEKIHVTASLGVAAFEAATHYDSVEELIAAADRAVYRAKDAGRNCIRYASDMETHSWRAPPRSR